MTNNLEIFRSEFLQAYTWAQRKDGVPLRFLDRLTAEERKVAETELIGAATVRDTWPIIGLGYIKSVAALPTLYNLLSESEKDIKVTIAYSIYQINQDKEMIRIVLEETPKLTNWYGLIDILYFLPDFNDESVNILLNTFCTHDNYLVAYNATRALELATSKKAVKKRRKNK